MEPKVPKLKQSLPKEHLADEALSQDNSAPDRGPGVSKIALGTGCGIILAPFLLAGLTCGGCAMLASIGSLLQPQQPAKYAPVDGDIEYVPAPSPEARRLGATGCPDWDDINVRIKFVKQCSQQCGGDGTVSEKVGDCFEECVDRVSCSRSHSGP